MDQGNYPNFDRPIAYQPYPNQNYPPPGNNFYPQHANNDYNHQHDLQKPLIHDDHHKVKKHEHKLNRKIKRVVSAIVGFVCLVIELGVIYYIRYSAYIFEYCYWKLGYDYYKSNVDQTLAFGNGKDIRDDFYFNIGCFDNADPFPECPMFCEYASQISGLDEQYLGYAFHSVNSSWLYLF